LIAAKEGQSQKKKKVTLNYQEGFLADIDTSWFLNQALSNKSERGYSEGSVGLSLFWVDSQK